MENVDNIIIEHLCAIRADVGTIRDGVRELKNRVTNLELGQATIMQSLGHQSAVSAQQNVSYDRIVDRIEKIEKKLEIAG